MALDSDEGEEPSPEAMARYLSMRRHTVGVPDQRYSTDATHTPLMSEVIPSFTDHLFDGCDVLTNLTVTEKCNVQYTVQIYRHNSNLRPFMF